MTVGQVLAAFFSTYMKFFEASVILTLDLHQVFLLTGLFKCLQNVFVWLESVLSKFAQLLVLRHALGQRTAL